MTPASSPTPPSPGSHAALGVATVHLVDDDESFLRSAARLLTSLGFTVATYSAAAAFLRDLKPGLKGCVVTDLRMPGMDGFGLQEALRSKGSSLPVLFFTGQGDIPSTVRAIRSGAEDFLLKTGPQEKLVLAVRAALARHEAILVKESTVLDFREKFARLSLREKQVLEQVVQGKLNKQIAADLGIHERTVKLHRTNLTGKLRVYSVAELTRLVQGAQVF